MKTTKILLISILALCLVVCQAKVSEAAEPMGTAFTYQGHLYDANDVANGEYDFQFKLYDANVGGGQAGSDVNKPDVDVIDAYFTVELDFGSDVFDSNERWLEIGVRPGDQNDPCTYATLVPRQEVTPTPYALYAKATGTVPVPLNLNSASSEPLIFASNSGGIGVRGSSSSTYGVYGSGIGANAHGIRGDSENQYGVLGFSNNSYGLYGQSANSYAGYFDGDAKVTGDLIVDSNVGIGTSTPSAKLTVNGAILRSGSTMHGTNASNHINLGANSTTGESGQNWSYATVGGGWSNDATGFSSTIAGGYDNTAFGYGTVGGGSNNEASSSAATVGGGRDNTADGSYSFAAGRRAKANHDGSFVWADSADANFASTGSNQFLIRASGNVGIGTTSPTEILDVNGTVKATAFSGDGSGLTNLPATPDGDWTIDGSDMYSGVSGNVGIGTSSPNAKLDVNDGAVLFGGSIGGTPVSGAGKRLMWIPSRGAFRAGGVSGTEWNDISIGIYSTAMGQNNTASGGWSTIGGGGNNTAGSAATVGGGLGNTANGSWSTVSGGLSNTASYSYATVSGGTNNTADGNDSTIGGGNYSTASGISATIGGGYNNYALGHQSTVGGGIGNTAGAYSATVGGGSNNIADSNYATVGGGYSNYVSGTYATVPGGGGNRADGDFSFAAGRRAKANHDGSFVWADSCDVDFVSTSNDQFLIRASGGVGIGTASPTEKLEVNGNLKVTGNIIGGLKTYDSGWFAVSTNTTYSKTHNLGTTKVLAVIYVAADSSGTHMSMPTTASDEFIVVSQITTTTCVVRTNTWVARHWDGSSWVNSSYARIIMMALE